MQNEHIIRLRVLFDEVFDLDAEARQRYLDAHHAQDTELRRALERLLTQEQANPFELRSVSRSLTDSGWSSTIRIFIPSSFSPFMKFSLVDSDSLV